MLWTMASLCYWLCAVKTRTGLIEAWRESKNKYRAAFIGTTRDTFEDKQVLELRYEVYIHMALRQLRAICSAARNWWKLMRLAVAHRLGIVPVGEWSVFVAVSSVHRRDYLEACEYVIDEIKASVLIWKKKFYTNGEVWKEKSEFFLRKTGESGNETSLKQHKACENSRRCGWTIRPSCISCVW